ncbi:unnamed protein product [Camellia sinensis]
MDNIGLCRLSKPLSRSRILNLWITYHSSTPSPPSMENTRGRESNPIIRDKEEDCHDNPLALLPKEKGWTGLDLYLYQGFWCSSMHIQGVMSFQQHFKAQDTDLILATMPKSGATWLKALTFAIANRHRYTNTLSQHPLLTSNPHDLVPFHEINLSTNKDGHRDGTILSLSNFQSSIFSTHMPYHSLPDSIKTSNCRIVYLCRNPYDSFVSAWHFFSKPRPESIEPLSCNDAFDMYCRGVIGFGPFWDNVLGYWKESLKRPQKVLFLMYEDLKEDIIFQMKRLAEFMSIPFSLEEESEGVIEDISRLCNFNNMRELEVNKTGKSLGHFENETLFRRGEVGDWINHFTPEMVERLNKVIEEKLGGSGLAFKTSL